MLEALLIELKKGTTTSPTLLAERLDTTPGMIQAMLDTLEEQGYIQTLAQECTTDKPCDGCTLANLCSSKDGGKARVRIFSENLKKA